MSKRTGILTCLVLVCGVTAASLVLAQAKKKPAPGKADTKGKPAGEKPKPAPPKPTTYKVKRGPFKVEVKTQGVFEARTMHEIVFRPKVWADLTVEKAVAHGRRVKKGEVVLALKTKKIDEALREAEAGKTSADLALKLMQEDLKALEKTAPLDLAAAERGKKQADEDFERYQKTERPQSIRSAEFSLKRAENLLEYQVEELRQLEKMYKADDLTEETEEIVLKRQRNSVERAKFSLVLAKTAYEKTIKISIPRRDITAKEKVVRQAIGLAKTKATLPMTVRKMRLDLAKQQRATKKTAEKLEKLRGDRKTMVVKAPADGVAYYGGCVKGKWAKLSQSLKPHTKLLPGQVAMTIVQPRPMLIRASVPEKEFHRLKEGAKVEIAPAAFPDVKIKSRIETISPVPVAPGAFEITMRVEPGKDGARIVPAMNASVVVRLYENDRALAVPASAVKEEKGKRFVYVKTKDGPKKRDVTVGQKAGGKAEITRGLKEGDVVFLQKPKDAK